MTEGEPYKEFDTSSIISKDTVSIGKFTLRKRELLLLGITAVVLIAVIILAIVLAVKVGECNSASNDDYCAMAPCLKTAYYEKSIMNESADPCVNFYEFACGGYSSIYSPSQLLPDQSPFDQIFTDNVQKLIYLLEYEPERVEEKSYERKLRHFIKSCTNHFDKMELRGQPLITKVLKPLGNGYLLGQWTPSTFSLHDQLKKVHIDFWTPAFFSIYPSVDQHNWNKKVIELYEGGLGMYSMDYNTSLESFYRDHMTKLAGFVVRDANVTVNDSRIMQFVDDAIEVESALASIVLDLPYQADAHAEANRMTLGSINTLMDNTVNFVDLFKNMFPGLPFTINENTAIAVLQEGFFHQLGPLLKSYSSNDDGKRKLHNYMVWQLINQYSGYLSWDYVHAKRQLNHNMYEYKETTSGFEDCIFEALDAMQEAMSAVFVKEYVNQKDKQEATNIMNVLKAKMMEGLKSLDWASSDNKNQAIKKINDSLYKIGYPDFMVDDAYMDSLYSNMKINETDYFGNVLSLNTVHRMRFRDELAMPDSKTMWAYPIMLPFVEYYNPWHELIATAAIFQYPLFAHNGPAYYNYGGMGTLLATNLFHAVDEYGSKYKLDQSNPGVWWTNFTQEHYLSIKECAINAQKDEQLGPYTSYGGGKYTPNMTEKAVHFAPALLAEASGLRLALKAYKSKLATTSTEKVPAGFTQYSLDKMFFVAYAQAHCHNTPESLQSDRVRRHALPGEYKVNLAVSQVPEFKDAFACPKGAPMAAETICQLF